MILDELRIALAQGIRRLFFSDSDLSEILEFSPKLYDEIVALLAEHPEARSLIFANVRHVDDPLLPRIVSDFRAQRVHLGVQSLQPKVLRAVGRSWAIPFLPNIENIPSVVRERLVVELIYPLPEETLESFMNGIQRLLDMGIYGFTIYPLSALRGTQLRKQIRDDPGYSFLESAPYHVFKTPSFSSNDWLTAAGISYVLNTLCNLANDADGAGNEVLRRILGQRPDMVRTIGSLVAEGADLPHLVTTWFSEAVGTQTEFMWDGPHPVTAVILHPHETERQAPNDSDPTPPSPPQDLPDPSDVAAWIEQAGCSALCSTVTGGGLWVSVEASFGVFDLVVTSVHMPGQAFSTVGPYNLSYSGTCKDIGVMERIVRAAQQALERDGKHSHSR